MTKWRRWLLTSVTAEIVTSGLANVDIYRTAEENGISQESLNVRFSNQQEVITVLISEIAQAHKQYVIEITENITTPRDRLVHFIASSIEYVTQNPIYGNVIVNGLYSNDQAIKDHVYEVYAKLFELLIPDLIDEGIVSGRSYALISDLSTILLSVTFEGNCPQLMMEYTSWVDEYRVAESVVNALQKRYQKGDIEARFL